MQPGLHQIFVDAEDLGGSRAVKFFDISKSEDFAINVRQLRDSFAELLAQFPALQSGEWNFPPIREECRSEVSLRVIQPLIDRFGDEAIGSLDALASGVEGDRGEPRAELRLLTNRGQVSVCSGHRLLGDLFCVGFILQD